MKYSVIIPVYNAEKTIRRCIDSLVDQNYENAEIILVNDGSSDHSGEICFEYAERFAQVRYFEKENGGVSSARNLGLDYAAGEYILFVDSDDWVDSAYFRVIDELIVEHDCDYLIFSQYIVKNGVLDAQGLSDFVSNTQEALMKKISEAMCKKYINGPVEKVYKKEIIRKYSLHFHDDIAIGEDRTFNLKYALHIHSMVITHHLLYYVDLGNEKSLSRRINFDLDEQMKKSEQYVFNELDNVSLSEGGKSIFVQAHNFDVLRSVYTKAKYLHMDHQPLITRYRQISQYCKAVNQQQYRYPPSNYCRIIAIPVKWRLIGVIDAMAWYLTR